MRIILVDLHTSLVDAARRIGYASRGDATPQWQGIEFSPNTSVDRIPRTKGTAFVSPANSLGFMDGGIDYVLSRVMFPGVEGRVKASFRREGKTSVLGRAYLPIGCATVVPADDSGDVKLIAAPTMWLPQDVRDTHNAYSAMFAILTAAKRTAGVHTVVVPGLCTGYGKMQEVQALRQMRDAHLDFLAGLEPRYTLDQIADEQPLLYENTEFKTIDPASVVPTGHTGHAIAI